MESNQGRTKYRRAIGAAESDLDSRTAAGSRDGAAMRRDEIAQTKGHTEVALGALGVALLATFFGAEIVNHRVKEERR